jgi:hypothetical protein
MNIIGVVLATVGLWAATFGAFGFRAGLIVSGLFLFGAALILLIDVEG